jgi:hypothetical protein
MPKPTTVTWFDGESGTDILEVPFDAIDACSHPGPCDDDVARWLPHVKWLASPDTIRKCLQRYGAWNREELADDNTNRARALCLAASDISENPTWYYE